MPDYKKKKVRRLGGSPSPKNTTKRRAEEDEIEMERPKKHRSQSNKKTDSMRVITGKKLIRRRRIRTAACVAAVLAVIICVLQFMLPVGIIESTGNFVATLGAGSFPIELYGTETLNSATRSNYFYVLTDTELVAVSAGGKKIYSVSHGFGTPVLKHSETRALIFDQNGFRVNIYNLSGEVSAIVTERNILNAALTRNGGYAIVTESEEYASVVSVYDRKDKLLYEWYSATDPVNNVALSPDGKMLAVSTVSADDGELHSRLYVLEYESPDPVYSADFTDTVVYSLEGLRSGFAVCTADSVSYIAWKDFKRTDYSTELSLAFARSDSSGLITVFNRQSNRADNKIVVFSKKGEKTAEFAFEGLISDIVMSRGHIYCISDTDVYLFDKTGQLLSKTACGFGAARLAVLSGDEVAVISGSSVSRLEISEKE